MPSSRADRDDQNRVIQAFEKSYDRYARVLLLAARRWGLDEVEAHDVVQDTFVRAFERIDLIKPESIYAYLMTVLRSQVMARLRQRRTFDKQVNPIDTPDDPKQEDVVATVRDAMASLPEDDRQMLLLRFVEGKTIAEIAEASGKSFSAVAARLFRARKRLWQTLRGGNS